MLSLKINRSRKTLLLPHRRENTEDDGFSLVELVTVVAVMAIITVIAIPQYNQIVYDAKVAVGKDLLNNIIKECMVVSLNKGSATVGDLQMTAYGKKQAPGGHRLGISFGVGGNHAVWGGYVLDTDLNSQIQLRPSHSCYQVAAKSGHTHFMIKYNEATETIERDCRIDPGATLYRPSTCDPSRPAGQHW